MSTDAALKSLDDDAHAREVFRACCASETWVQRMLDARPYVSPQDLLAQANHAFEDLNENDWLQAFAAHPRIGDNKSPQQSAAANRWSQGEQSGVQDVDGERKRELARLNDLYAERFGFTYIVCASGRSGQELLTLLQERVDNEREEEMCTAAGEQEKITQLRLEKWLHGH